MEPELKKQKRDQCEKILSNGKQCSFSKHAIGEFCRRHSAPIKVLSVDASTNTSHDYSDNLTIAEETIINMLADMTRKDKYIEQLEHDYNILKEKVISNFLST